MEDRIDFVIIWVDGSDPEWRSEKAKYTNVNAKDIDDREERYRDYDLLRYWFRGVDKFAPWVNHIWFITCGQVPEWLNLNSPKLTHVRHSDYIPQEYLPTFSSHPIELNLHRIKGLSDHFVYFNDDMYIINKVEPTDFFRNGIPVHTNRLHAILPRHTDAFLVHVYMNMMVRINAHFDFHRCLKKRKGLWFSPWKIGLKMAIENIIQSQYSVFPGFWDDHLPVPFLKSTFDEVWEREYETLHATSLRKLRNKDDVSQYLFRYWQMASGRFVPQKPNNLGIMIGIDKVDTVIRELERQRQKIICINDSEHIRSFEDTKVKVGAAFDKVLSEKCSFEK